MSPYRFRRARPNDLPVVQGLLAAAADDMHRRGFTAWPQGGFPDTRIAPTIAAGTVWLALDGTGRAAATITIDGVPDPEFGAAGLDPTGRAVIVHRMARHPDLPRQGLGGLLLDFACHRARAAGLGEVWLNVNRAAIALQAWYLRHGFTHLATVTSTGRQSGWLASRPADLPPVRLCCQARHHGAVCPDGRVLCQLCFRRVPVADLARDAHGTVWDVCQPCGVGEHL